MLKYLTVILFSLSSISVFATSHAHLSAALTPILTVNNMSNKTLFISVAGKNADVFHWFLPGPGSPTSKISFPSSGISNANIYGYTY
jgi:hypothetical protein